MIHQLYPDLVALGLHVLSGASDGRTLRTLVDEDSPGWRGTQLEMDFVRSIRNRRGDVPIRFCEGSES